MWAREFATRSLGTRMHLLCVIVEGPVNIVVQKADLPVGIEPEMESNPCPTQSYQRISAMSLVC